MKKQIPQRLKKGSTIGLIAPSGVIRSPDGLERAIAAVKAEGFKVKLGDSCGKVYGYLSGPDDVRARDINKMFLDDKIDGIFCIRGGYGAARLLPLIEFGKIKKHPKAFLGYSDVTALHVALFERCGLITYHGPMPVSDWISDKLDPFSMKHLISMMKDPIDREITNPPGYPLETINGGKAEGRLVGGNLTLITGLIGTPWALNVKGRILFLEDIGEKTYQLDHHFTQLRNAGMLDDCAGILLGQFTNCPIEYEEFGLSLNQIVRDILVPSEKPILMNLMAGHDQPSLTLPLGANVKLNADKQIIQISP